MKSTSEHCRCVLFSDLGNFAPDVSSDSYTVEYSAQQLKEMCQKQAEIDNKVRLDLGDEERKKKLEEPTAESNPLTRLMNDTLGGEVWKVM